MNHFGIEGLGRLTLKKGKLILFLMLSNTINCLVSHNILGSLILIIYSVYFRGRYLHMHLSKLVSNHALERIPTPR